MRSAAFTAALLLLPVRAALGAECNVLTPADIKAVTGAARGTSTGNQVTGLEHSSLPPSPPRGQAPAIPVIRERAARHELIESLLDRAHAPSWRPRRTG